MTMTIESKLNKTNQRAKHRWSPFMGQEQLSARPPANDKNYATRDTRRNMLYSRHTHHDPQQVAIEEALDGWARHAAASNGFGDMP